MLGRYFPLFDRPTPVFDYFKKVKYAVRYSEDINSDMVRGWSAWTMVYFDTPEDLFNEMVSFAPQMGQQAQAEWSRWSIEHGPDYRRFMIHFLKDVRGLDIRQDQYGRWALVHHDGLSCFEVEADNQSEAMEKAMKEAERMPIGYGHMTVGKVELIGPVPGRPNWWLLAAEDVVEEPD